MTQVSTFYFSRIVGKKVYPILGNPIGKCKDLIVDVDFIRPKVVAAVLQTGGGLLTVDFSGFKVEKRNGQYRFFCSEIKEYKGEGKKIFSLAKNILDRQIVDMDGRKLVRVNDLRLAVLSGETYLIAADIGFEGLLRRLGIAKPVKEMMRPLKGTLPSHLILWDEVELVDFGNAPIRLSKDYSNLVRLHPSDLADILEDMSRSTQISFLSSIDEEKAADILEELEPEIQKTVVESLPIAKAADLLEKMPADEAADILDEVRDDIAQELLEEMEQEASFDIRELMEYEDNTVGSIMATDYLMFDEEKTTGETIDELRRLKPEADTMYSIYIVDGLERLIASVSLRDLVIAQPQTQLREIMNRNVPSILDSDRMEALSSVIWKYNLLSVPVVDDKKELQGVVIINDVLHDLLKSKRKR